MTGTVEDTAEAVFVSLQAIRGAKAERTMAECTTAPEVPVMFGELVHYAYGTALVDELRVKTAINNDLSLRRQFDSLLKDARVASAPSQAQAASGAPEPGSIQRKTRAFSLNFKPSRASANQVYVLLTVYPESGLEDGHCPVIIASLVSEIGRLQFPQLKDQAAQLLMEIDDQRLVIAQNADAELSLI